MKPHTKLLFVEKYLSARVSVNWPFKGQPHKIVKQTQTIRQQIATNCLSVSDHFMGLALNGLRSILTIFRS